MHPVLLRMHCRLRKYAWKKLNQKHNTWGVSCHHFSYLLGLSANFKGFYRPSGKPIAGLPVFMWNFVKYILKYPYVKELVAFGTIHPTVLGFHQAWKILVSRCLEERSSSVHIGWHIKGNWMCGWVDFSPLYWSN